MSPASAPFNHCPAALVPVMLEILAIQPIQLTTRTQMDSSDVKVQSVFSQGIHENPIELNGSDYDQLLVLFYTAFGGPFSCQDPQNSMTYSLSFTEKPEVIQETITSETRHYTARVSVMKLPPTCRDLVPKGK